MRIPRKGEKGFTLIELLIVVAILGVLAAILIPNLSRFMGAGQEEARETELANVQAAVSSMMVDNRLSELPVPVVGPPATNDMTAFPDATTTPQDRGYTGGGTLSNGYLLYEHDRINPDDTDNYTTVNYVIQQYTTSYYTVDASGTVSQWKDASMTPYP